MNKWDQRFLDLAAVVATWSKDSSTQVGSVIVDKRNRVVSLGFNGFPHGVQDDIPFERDEKLRRTIHAEGNAILHARGNTEGCRIYVTHTPCARCAALIIQAGITQVITPPSTSTHFEVRWADDIASAQQMFLEAGVKT